MADEITLHSPLQTLQGIGAERAKLFATKLGIHNIYDLLMHLPYRYEDFTSLKKLAELKVGDSVASLLKIEKTRITYTPQRRVPILQVTFSDETANIDVTFFNTRLKSILKEGEKVLLTGKADYYNGLKISNPQVHLVEAESESGIVQPVYHASENLKPLLVRKTVMQAVEKYLDVLEIDELFPEGLLQNRGLQPVKQALKTVHNPDNIEEVEKAKNSLVYYEFFILQAALAIRREKEKPDNLRPLFTVSNEAHSRILKRLPFDPTNDQFNAFAQLREDFASNSRMMRLLQGDVGTGKTVVAFYASLAAVANGFQVAFMAPTEVLAKQHFNTFRKFLENSKVSIELLTSGLKRAKRAEILKKLRIGEIDILIGTHALIEPDVKFKKLGVVIVDEQHKFGVFQRYKLLEKGNRPHMLVMTATPIPRTLALTVYGDLDITTLRDKPTGNVEIITRFVANEKIRELYAFLNARIKKGEQVYYICPFVEQSLKSLAEERKSVISLTQKLRKIFPKFAIEPIYGKMPSSEKEQKIADFADGKIDILVSSTVMEVGIDNPNATIIVIDDAHRFGLSQLHQLRGRVGRGGRESYCFLVATPETEEAKQRLKKILETTDGFEIAETDLKLRGAGELYGLKQHGLPNFRIANPLENFELLNQARNDAFKAIAKNEINRELLLKYVKLHFGQSFFLTTTA